MTTEIRKTAGVTTAARVVRTKFKSAFQIHAAEMGGEISAADALKAYEQLIGYRSKKANKVA
jgi:hypothetical protein